MDTFQTFLNACRNGQKSIVKILLERGGDHLNRRDAEGNTALHYACREGYRDLAVLLLEKGADAGRRTGVRSSTPPPKGQPRILGPTPQCRGRSGCRGTEGLHQPHAACGEPPHGCRSVARSPRCRHRGYGPNGTPRAGLCHGTRTDGGGRAPHANRCGRRHGA